MPDVSSTDVLSSGSPGGFTRGTLVEWLSSGKGSGAGLLAMLIARQAACQGGAIVVLDRAETFHAPALCSWGIDVTRVVVVRAGNEKDQLWALDQALRCRGVAAVWVWLDRIDARTFRRLQLAAEEGGSLGLLLRPARVRGLPSWSDVQLLVTPQSAAPAAKSNHWRFRVERVRSRSSAKLCSVTLEIDTATGSLKASNATGAIGTGAAQEEQGHETHTLHLVSQLAHPTTRRRPASA